jgi:hypothetical protein
VPHDLDLVERAVRLLQDGGFDVAVFGGWGEELRGLRPPGSHGDVDLLVLDAAPDRLDKFLKHCEEIPAKRLPHKRAFRLDDVAVELFLAFRTAHGAEIRWWGEHPVELPNFATSQIHRLPVADANALTHYRRSRPLLADGLWDHDFHPDEPDVRTFVVPPLGILRRDDTVVVTIARYGDHVLRHYAFADRWFKINATTDLDGRPAIYGDDGFTFNCDIATPMLRQGVGVHAVDLFLDVLVDQSGRTYDVIDRAEFAQAVLDGVVSGHEASQAEAHLQDLVAIVRDGQLLSWLDSVCPFGPSAAPDALPMVRTAITPVVAAVTRPSW